jgi:CDP-glucose 4,6-dehydratase
MKLFGDIYSGRKVLITGHTGFKGSWLALWLKELGAIVSGVSLSPVFNKSHWDLLQLNLNDHRQDIRDFEALQKIFHEVKPEIVFHLAAQPLVRNSYLQPLETWSTNIMGMANVLEACRQTGSVQAIVAITSDKCYENCEWPWGYRENDRLGGHDPYSASKAGAELLASSYRKAFFNLNSYPLLATARSGNVIGGGDWSEDRLLPDLMRSIIKSESLEIRFPQATRPWQHVLESLSGYLLIGQKLLIGDKISAEAWNFGPETEGNKTVSELLTKLNKQWTLVNWHINSKNLYHEASLLYIDSSKARSKLGWQPVWNFETAVEKTVNWYRAWIEKDEIISRLQLFEYIEKASRAKIDWTNH